MTFPPFNKNRMDPNVTKLFSSLSSRESSLLQQLHLLFHPGLHMHFALLKCSNLVSGSSRRRRRDFFFHKKRFSVDKSELCRTTDPFGVVGILASVHIHWQNWNIRLFGIRKSTMFELHELDEKKSDCTYQCYIIVHIRCNKTKTIISVGPGPPTQLGFLLRVPSG
jgi:hypothetical protein